MKRSLSFLLVFVTLTSWAQSSAYVSTYAELSAAVANASVNNIVVTANIDVPCETSGNAGDNDLTGVSTAQLIINRSLTLQSQAGSKYIVKRVAANDANASVLKSMIAIRGNGHGNSGTDNLAENTVEVAFTNIILDGGADWGASNVNERRNSAADAYGHAGRSMIDVYLGGVLNLEDGVELRNGYTTKSDNSLLNDASTSQCFGGAVRVDYHNETGGGTVNIKAGAIIHDCSTWGASGGGYGGALGAYNYARLNLYGGTIYNCSSVHGGAIACTYRGADGYGKGSAGTIRMYGGTISNCYAKYGGAISMDGTVENYLLGGNITSCSAGSQGGAVWLNAGSPTLHIVSSSSGWLTISSCTPYVEGTESTGNYPCIYMSSGSSISSTPVYQVSFIHNNTEFAVLHVLQGDSLGEAFPAAPVYAGLRFIGWYNGDTQVTGSTAITDNITLTARWDFFGSGTNEDPYQIPSAEAWDFFADKVMNGNSFSEKFFRLTNDISVTTMVGNNTGGRPFCGTFDGNKMTLNVSIEGSGESTAAFGALNGALIKDLHITGSVNTTALRPASIAGFITGNSTITNCWSEVDIRSSQEDYWVDAGAFVARINSGKTLTLNGCLFTGSITYSDPEAYEGGGMVGWAQNNTFVKFYDCVFAPSTINITNYIDQFTFAATYEGYADKTLQNCYFNDVANATKMTTEGKHWHSITADADVTLGGLGAVSVTYNVSGITAYAHGIKYNDVFYAGDGESVALSLGHSSKTGYTFSQYAVTGGGSLENPDSDTPTLTMTDSDQVISAVWTPNESLPITVAAATVLGESKYVATFYHGTLAYQLPAGALAYTAGKDGDKVVFYRIGSDSNVIPADTAVIIVAEASAVSEGKLTLTNLLSTDVIARDGNILQGSDTDIAKPSGTVCVLGVAEGVLGFYPLTGDTIPAGKAYFIDDFEPFV